MGQRARLAGRVLQIEIVYNNNEDNNRLFQVGFVVFSLFRWKKVSVLLID